MGSSWFGYLQALLRIGLKYFLIVFSISLTHINSWKTRQNVFSRFSFDAARKAWNDFHLIRILNRYECTCSSNDTNFACRFTDDMKTKPLKDSLYIWIDTTYTAWLTHRQKDKFLFALCFLSFGKTSEVFMSRNRFNNTSLELRYWGSGPGVAESAFARFFSGNSLIF